MFNDLQPIQTHVDEFKKKKDAISCSKCTKEVTSTLVKDYFFSLNLIM